MKLRFDDELFYIVCKYFEDNGFEYGKNTGKKRDRELSELEAIKAEEIVKRYILIYMEEIGYD